MSFEAESWGASALTLRGVTFAPALFCAPMAGLTHSAFRRLVADFGGYGALFTEMLSGRWLLRENLERSPSVKRRAQEGRVIYQLMIAEPEEVPAVVERLRRVEPCGLDLNCACPAPHIRAVGAGSELFEDRARLGAMLDALRRCFDGVLTVKIRLGRERPDWQERLSERLALMEGCGVDGVVLHPRFTEEKLRRRARHGVHAVLRPFVRLPLIASGDLTGSAAAARLGMGGGAVSGLMLGRIAVVQPWVFANWGGAVESPDRLEVWQRFVRYVNEDFEPPKAFYRVRAFTAYYARNFLFGHSLFAITQSAPDLETLCHRAETFLKREPELATEPAIAGLH